MSCRQGRAARLLPEALEHTGFARDSWVAGKARVVKEHGGWLWVGLVKILCESELQVTYHMEFQVYHMHPVRTLTGPHSDDVATETRPANQATAKRDVP